MLEQYFEAWAETTKEREVDRSFKRLKTQTAFVQYQETELEARRKHCRVAPRTLRLHVNHY